jgi:hypothetical protein
VAVLRDALPGTLQKVAQLTVEFHDFLDGASRPAIRSVIKKMRGPRTLVIRFSWHTYGDVLFVNRRREPLSLWQRTDLTVVRKYGHGLGWIAQQDVNGLTP